MAREKKLLSHDELRKKYELTAEQEQVFADQLRERLSADVDVEELLSDIRDRLPHCVTDYPDIHKKVNRADYIHTFADYKSMYRGIFEDLEVVCFKEPERKSEHIELLVALFLDEIQAFWQQKAIADKLKYEIVRDNGKIGIAVFLVPMIRDLDLDIGDEFCNTLRDLWNERNPGSTFRIGSYEEIVNGWKSRFCFITTAVCREQGKPDDCEELTAFRAFRDGYLMGCPDGPALVREYYDIAPGIVTCLELCGSGEDYRSIRETYLEPCYADLRAGRMEPCKARYIRMVRDLERKYLA